MKHKIIGARISSKYFMYQAAHGAVHGVFTAEISDFNGFNPLSQIWDDFCDLGFVMVSEKTGAEVVFSLDHEVRDAENDITHWIFEPSLGDITKNEKLRNITVTIYND